MKDIPCLLVQFRDIRRFFEQKCGPIFFRAIPQGKQLKGYWIMHPDNFIYQWFKFYSFFQKILSYIYENTRENNFYYSKMKEQRMRNLPLCLPIPFLNTSSSWNLVTSLSAWRDHFVLIFSIKLSETVMGDLYLHMSQHTPTFVFILQSFYGCITILSITAWTLIHLH